MAATQEGRPAHSRFGGSKADRWMNCSGSTALCDTVPQAPSSRFADEGNAAHALAALCLQKDQHPREWLGMAWIGEEQFTHAEVPGAPVVTDEMCEAVVTYLNVVLTELAQTKGAELYVEHGFVLDVASADPGEVFGTNDAMVYHPKTGRLVVFDYKHGVGVSVSAEDSAQLKFYAAGAVFSKPDWRVSQLELVIVQPRSRDLMFLPEDASDDLKKGIKRWPMDPLGLMDFQVEVEDAIGRAKLVEGSGDHWFARIDDINGTSEVFKTGSWCRWCDAAAVCPAKEREVLQQAQLGFSDITEITVDVLPEPKSFDLSRLGEILKAGTLLNAWLGQVQEYVEALVLAGTPVPGWKAVEKIGRAKWVSADADVAAYADMMHGVALVEPKLVTITEAEKRLKAAGVKKDGIDSFKLQFTIKESSGLTIAPESDKRPAVNAAERAFGDIAV